MLQWLSWLALRWLSWLGLRWFLWDSMLNLLNSVVAHGTEVVVVHAGHSWMIVVVALQMCLFVGLT